MTFDLSEKMAIWIGNTSKNVIKGIETGGIGLPAAVLYSAKEYYTDVRNVTPPANGGTVASLALERGKARITIDMRKSLRVVKAVTGKRIARPLEWYLQHRWKRKTDQLRFDVSVNEFNDIEKQLHRRVGYMQSGWNNALKRFKAKIPAWVANKNGRGSVAIRTVGYKFSVIAKNEVAAIRSVQDMQRRIDWVSKIHKKRLERASAMQAKAVLERMFK